LLANSTRLIAVKAKLLHSFEPSFAGKRKKKKKGKNKTHLSIYLSSCPAETKTKTESTQMTSR